jgi:hypothetical protein
MLPFRGSQKLRDVKMNMKIARIQVQIGDVPTRKITRLNREKRQMQNMSWCGERIRYNT